MRTEERTQVFEQLSKIIYSRFKNADADAVNTFVKQYYHYVHSDDLLEREVEDLYGAALAHWHLAQVRKPDETLIHVYNPTLEDHGWQSTHTVIEIVTNDMPFLVNSVSMELNRHGLTYHLIVHPIMHIRRNNRGRVLQIKSSADADAKTESLIHVEVDYQGSGKAKLEEIRSDLIGIIGDIRAATEDWPACMERLKTARDALAKNPPGDPNQDVSEALAFLDWLADEHFVFIGSREYELVKGGEPDGFRIVPKSGLGVLRDEIATLPADDVIPVTAEVCAFVSDTCPLMITKATSRSTIHRPIFLDYVGVKKFNSNGAVIGEYRFLGLYTSSAYHSNPQEVPLLRHKVQKIMNRSGFKPYSHSGKALMNVLQGLPRDELFHTTEDELLRCALGVLQLRERQRVRLFIRRDLYGHFISVLLYVPRDRYNTEIRQRMQDVLAAALEATEVEFNVQFSDSILARIHFILHTESNWTVEYEVAELEHRLVEILRVWKDDLKEALRGKHGEGAGGELFNRYSAGFTVSYQENFTPRVSVLDVDRMEALRTDQSHDIQMMLYRPLESNDNSMQFKLYCRDESAPLSLTLPMLENMGVSVRDERSFNVDAEDSESSFWIHDFGLVYDAELPDIESIKSNFQQTFEQVWCGRIENDGFNRLVMKANLDWCAIMVLRAYYFYLRQTGATFSQAYVVSTLNNNPHTTAHLFKFFSMRFDPDEPRTDAQLNAQVKTIEHAIEQVASLDEDRILRRFLNLIQATQRTSFFQAPEDEKGVPYVAFKFDPSQISELPSPRPKYEIFVYSPRVEGVHLRGGMVARGGLRWSDRREDFRTEILGLMKAQMSKNAVIVPTGAKGGFIVKDSLEGLGRDEVMAEVVACYKVFVGALLDITDNLVDDLVVPPKRVVRKDGDDPYLVVAADKGTATFSDVANGIAKQYGFWLGDAFASGGSAGYDHKKMGITARGAWESVKRHFREIGIDTQTTPFTVMGIGDMGGDVFGNGMLLSEQIRLLGAFNHLHIFLDPDPDPAASFKERQRLFNKPRSTWDDYNKKLISKGGGVFARSSKSIALTPEIQGMLGVTDQQLAPNDLIRCMLMANVDLLWNGGIGTYVKSRHEHNDQVGDRTNDSLRINGLDLRCKVVGEGGNLGFTQLGRVEYTAKGGRMNTDAIDNSAGVDCSDHEVNIKILLNKLVTQGDMTEKQRNSLLAKMTDDVSGLVLRNNYLQSQAITMIRRQAPVMLEVHARLMELLSQKGRLNRDVEYLPNADEIEERKSKGDGLYRPEIAVLMAYSKLYLKDVLSNTVLLQDPKLGADLSDYFPKELQLRFGAEIGSHRLRNEIITNQLVNKLINRLGPSFPYRMQDETGASPSEVVRSFKVACVVFNADELWQAIESLDGKVSPDVQLDMLMEVRKLIERSMFWLRRNRSHVTTIGDAIAEFGQGVQDMQQEFLTHLSKTEKQNIKKRTDGLVKGGVPKPLAGKIASLDAIYSCLDILAVQATVERSASEVLPVYLALNGYLKLDWLYDKISHLPRRNFWQSLARTALRDDLHAENRGLTANLFKWMEGKVSPAVRIAAWQERHDADIQRYLHLIGSIKSGSQVEIEQLSVILKELHALVEKSAVQTSQ